MEELELSNYRMENHDLTTYDLHTVLIGTSDVDKRSGQDNRSQWCKCRNPEKVLFLLSLQ